MSNTIIPEILSYPIFFEPNRVWRLYKGGALLDEMATGSKGKDGFFPEEWVASTTVAQNGVNQQSDCEGLSRIAGSDKTLCGLLADYPMESLGKPVYDGEGVGLLCKFIDSAIRLPIQCHPDVAFAKMHCGSNHGKTEMWIVIGTRPIGGAAPYVYIGFKPDIDKEKFKKAVYEQDLDFITSSMHKYEVNESDMYFIPGRLAHAIGAGVLILEVQEPTDLVVQPEKYLDGVELSEEDMWKGLEPEVGLDCFDYDNVFSREETLRRFSLKTRQLSEGAGFAYYDIVNKDVTDYFKVQSLSVSGSAVFKPDMPWYIGVVAVGSGQIIYGGKTFDVSRGSYFFAPATLGEIEYKTQTKMDIYLIAR